MRHLGDVSKVNGAEIEPVDIITFGSPCQDLSVAGKRAGIKDGTRSGLFLEAIRITKEMRVSTGGMYPTFALWENVPGAFSSNGGEDFRTVLQELVKIKEPSAVMPPVPVGGWPYADSYMGDGWSLAYRTLDAQYWGVPQRRRRIYLVADFGGQRAGEILFKRQGLRGYFAESGTPWKGIAADTERGTEADDRNAGCLNPWDNQSKRIFPPDAQYQTLYAAGFKAGQGAQARSIGWEKEKTPTLASEAGGNSVPSVCVAYDARGNGDGVIVNTITGDHENRITDYTTVICLQGNGIDRSETAGCNGNGWKQDVCYTLNTVDRPGVAYAMQGFGDYKESECGSGLKARDFKDATDLVVECAGVDCRNMNEYDELYPTLQAKPNGGQSLNFSGAVRTRYIVRRLTPTECARLQGFPDEWGHLDHKDDFTDEEYTFWMDVRNTHAAINGKAERQYTKEQMLAWYNKLHTDSAEYRMWGNGIALPTALYVMQGIADALQIGGIKE
jgi:DNA (cytosine-5)-methyltransferase 1